MFILLEKSQFVVFSDVAVVGPRNNQLTLQFRIGNLSVSQLISASVRLLMIRPRRTLEGEIIPHQLYDMELTHLRNGQLFFPRPTVVEHIIDDRSPLHGIQRSSLESERFEIIAIIEGAFDHTGFSCHFRTSYLPGELLWGYQFSSCDSTLSGFDYEKFNHVETVDENLVWTYDDNGSSSPTTPISPNATSSAYERGDATKLHASSIQRSNTTTDELHMARRTYGGVAVPEIVLYDQHHSIERIESVDEDALGQNEDEHFPLPFVQQ